MQRVVALAALLVAAALVFLGMQQQALRTDVQALRDGLEPSAAVDNSTTPSPATSPAAAAPWNGDYEAEDAVAFWWAAEVSQARTVAAKWEAPGFDGAPLAGYGPAQFSCSDGDNGRLKLSAKSQSAQCEGVATNGRADFGSIIAVKARLLDNHWRVTEATNQGDAG